MKKGRVGADEPITMEIWLMHSHGPPSQSLAMVARALLVAMPERVKLNKYCSIRHLQFCCVLRQLSAT